MRLAKFESSLLTTVLCMAGAPPGQSSRKPNQARTIYTAMLTSSFATNSSTRGIISTKLQRPRSIAATILVELSVGPFTFREFTMGKDAHISLRRRSSILSELQWAPAGTRPATTKPFLQLPNAKETSAMSAPLSHLDKTERPVGWPHLPATNIRIVPEF